MSAELLIAVSGEVHTKARRTRARFRDVLAAALADGFARAGVDVVLEPHVVHGRFFGHTPEAERAAEVAAHVFGVRHVTVAEPLTAGSFGSLVTAAAEKAAPQVRGRTFAVRVHRHGDHPWRSLDLASAVGRELLPWADGVDLDAPEREIHLTVVGERAWLHRARLDGPGGLPAGVQGQALSLFSGGYDSAVATWRLMRRGVAVDLLHVGFECAAADQAALMAWTLWRRWGAGLQPTLWVVDGERLRDAVLGDVPRPYRQVATKRMMLQIADHLAARLGADALVTGDSVGQVSSQTLANLRAMGPTGVPVLRPLAGDDKDDIVRAARRIGIAEVAARAREVCDLAGPKVVVAATEQAVNDVVAGLPSDLAADLAANARPLRLSEWRPGDPVMPRAAAA